MALGDPPDLMLAANSSTDPSALSPFKGTAHTAARRCPSRSIANQQQPAAPYSPRITSII